MPFPRDNSDAVEGAATARGETGRAPGRQGRRRDDRGSTFRLVLIACYPGLRSEQAKVVEAGSG